VNDEPRIGEIAAACGVSVDTIRHYERKGVIGGVARDGSGYRRYPTETIDRVRVVRRALAIGFTLDELARIYRQRAAGQPPCRGVRALAARKLAELDQRIEELLKLRAAMSGTLESWDRQLGTIEEGELAHLLDSLIASTEDSQ
jgi:MerR family transcriptional regulator, copper efflux regulator